MSEMKRPADSVEHLEAIQLFRLSGSDIKKFLNNFCSAKVIDLSGSEVREGFILDVKGRVLALVSIFCWNEDLYLLALGSLEVDLLEHLDRYIITEDVEVTKCENAVACWSVDGEECSGEPSAKPQRFLVSVETAPNESSGNEPGANVVLKSGWSSGGKLVVAIEGGSFENHLGVNNERFATDRILNRYPVAGAEYKEKTIPQEMDRDEASIDFQKGCYLGQETVARLDALGHANWQLKIVESSNSEAITESFVKSIGTDSIGRTRDQWIAKKEGKPIAYLQSMVLAPEEDRLIGLAVIRAKELSDQPMVFQTEDEGNSVELKVLG